MEDGRWRAGGVSPRMGQLVETGDAPLARRECMRQTDIESRVAQGDLQLISQSAIAAAFTEVQGGRLLKRGCGDRFTRLSLSPA